MYNTDRQTDRQTDARNSSAHTVADVGNKSLPYLAILFRAVQARVVLCGLRWSITYLLSELQFSFGLLQEL